MTPRSVQEFFFSVDVQDAHISYLRHGCLTSLQKIRNCSRISLVHNNILFYNKTLMPFPTEHENSARMFGTMMLLNRNN